MSKAEDTPFVIDFKQKRQNNYGAAVPPSPLLESPSTSGYVASNNNNNNAGTPTAQIFRLFGGIVSVEVRDHCHRARSEGVDRNARRKLIIASVLCLVFMICEIIGGVLSNSLAIATDAAHLLTDFASFMISLFAIWIAGRPSTQRMSFGWYRAEVIGAMASVFMIWVITGILVWLAIERLISGKYEVDAEIMLITSGLAILVNLIMGVQLQHGHSHGLGGHSHAGGGAHTDAGDIEFKQQATNKPSALSVPAGMLLSGQAGHVGCNGLAASTTPCPASPTQRLEDGITIDVNAGGDLAPADAEPSGAGLATFSYQNSKGVHEVNSEIAAVMVETAPGAHNHGRAAGGEVVNMNVRAALIHVIGDIIQSLGVFVAALVIYFKPEWAIVDPICTFVFSVIVLFTTFTIMKDALLVLMEGTPNYMHYAEVLQVFQQIEGVERVHNLRIWALSINKVALSAHLAIALGADPKKVLDEATTAVHLRYNFFETTIQIEDYTAQMEDCIQCSVPNK